MTNDYPLVPERTPPSLERLLRVCPPPTIRESAYSSAFLALCAGNLAAQGPCMILKREDPKLLLVLQSLDVTPADVIILFRICCKSSPKIFIELIKEAGVTHVPLDDLKVMFRSFVSARQPLEHD